MSKYNQTTTIVCVNYGAPTITPISHFIASTATQQGSLVYNLKATNL